MIFHSHVSLLRVIVEIFPVQFSDGTRWIRSSYLCRVRVTGVYNLPSGCVKIALENYPFRVDIPNKHGDFPELC